MSTGIYQHGRITVDINQLAETWDDTPLDREHASLLKGGDPTLPERWQGSRPSLTADRGWAALVASWQEGERYAQHMHSVLSLRHTTSDAKRLAADLARIHKRLNEIDALEWRRVLDTSFICGLKGWSNLHRNALGDGTWHPIIRRGVRYKIGSTGTVVYG